jgi:hypothetical protein
MRLNGSYLFYSDVREDEVDKLKLDINVGHVFPCLFTRTSIDRATGSKRSLQIVWIRNTTSYDCAGQLFRIVHQFYYS